MQVCLALRPLLIRVTCACICMIKYMATSSPNNCLSLLFVFLTASMLLCNVQVLLHAGDSNVPLSDALKRKAAGGGSTVIYQETGNVSCPVLNPGQSCYCAARDVCVGHGCVTFRSTQGVIHCTLEPDCDFMHQGRLFMSQDSWESNACMPKFSL